MAKGQQAIQAGRATEDLLISTKGLGELVNTQIQMENDKRAEMTEMYRRQFDAGKPKWNGNRLCNINKEE